VPVKLIAVNHEQSLPACGSVHKFTVHFELPLQQIRKRPEAVIVIAWKIDQA
jgi:hypothetical protein